jgi:predicted mannosyl-3-phosphoglycerate phosphatase (HAD superfamily)
MTDPYTSTSLCVERLLGQYAKTPRLILAVDWDETLFDFHRKGYAFPRAINLIKRAQDLGFYIVIFTASKTERHAEIIQHCETLGITPDSINRNVIPSEYGNDGAKIFYNLLIDDRSGLGQALDILENTLDRIEKTGYSSSL